MIVRIRASGYRDRTFLLGKGFAVVANEVNNLANSTAKATSDIQSKVEAMQA